MCRSSFPRKPPQTFAAEIADDLGITVVGYARGGSMTVFTHPSRILGPAEGADE